MLWLIYPSINSPLRALLNALKNTVMLLALLLAKSKLLQLWIYFIQGSITQGKFIYK